LVGLRGSGKSTLGAMLAQRIDMPFIELDREIELLTGASLGELFAVFGQETFRQAEREALEKVLLQHPRFVMATSGSIVTEPRTLDLLLSSCFTIWMRASPAEHMSRVVAQGDLRPMANSPRAMDDLVAILQSREPFYARAEATVNTTAKSPQQSLDELMRVVGVQTHASPMKERS
jgi:XRE family aerobic/anaerobic benzoate catabolism transcriptional regulator